MPPLHRDSTRDVSRTSKALEESFALPKRGAGVGVESDTSSTGSASSAPSVGRPPIHKPQERTRRERFEMEDNVDVRTAGGDLEACFTLPTETPYSLLSGTYGDSDSSDTIAVRAQVNSFYTSVTGWRMLRWWACGVIIPLGASAWFLTGSVLAVIVAMLSMPLLAILQGSLQILRYRVKYGDCPLPKAPSHGIVRVQDRRGVVLNSNIDTSTDASKKERDGPEPDDSPLRLLVIGDSLAIGVGQSTSCTPVMPETIAKCLSRDMGGRPVLWTCHGAPGASAGWIVRELERSIKRGKFAQSSASSSFDKIEASGISNVDFDTDNIDSKTLETITTSGVVGCATSESDSSSDDFSDNNSEVDDERSTSWQERLRQERVHFDPNTVGPFDIAVVLTGSNDLKSAFFPFLLRGEDAKFRREAQQRGGGYGRELTRIIQVLNHGMRIRFQTLRESVEEATQKMRERLGSVDGMTQQHSNLVSSRRKDASRSNSSGLIEDPVDKRNASHSTNLFPMVVLPGMPARTLPIFSMAPLRWLAVPIVDIMDSHKQRLARRHRGEVLFVEAPTGEQITEFVDEEGEYWRQEQQDRILLRLRDIKRRHALQIEADMKDYYAGTNERPTTASPRNRHFSVFSVDGIHPNDVGYRFWGRHIAHHIVQDWNKKKQLATELAGVE